MVLLLPWLAVAPAAGGTRLAVPVVAQARERCGPAALTMVLRFYGADSAAARLGDCGYDPVLRGSLITDLARCAREAGFSAEVERPGEDSLRTLLSAGVPPVLLYDRGIGSVGPLHYAVVIGWDPERDSFVLNDGGSEPRRIRRESLMRRWISAGGQALVVRPGEP